MNITLYKTADPPNKINKSLSAVKTLTGTLRDSCSLMNPVITFPSSALEDKYNDVNYMYIEAFGRYYFIDEITSIASKLIQVRGSIDPLYTYKSSILKANVILNRTSSKSYYSRMIPDNQMKIKAVPRSFGVSFFSNGQVQNGWSIIMATT